MQPRISLDTQARDAFFTYLVPSISVYWDFLKRLVYAIEPPSHLTLAIEAVSLAYLWHQVYSDAALVKARQRYISALHLLSEVVRSSSQASKDATLLAALLLDVFEKITGLEHRDDESWMSHVNGGFALVRLRGLERFEDPFSIRLLVRTVTNHTTSCVVKAIPVSEELYTIRAYVADHVNVETPHWKIQDLLVDYANFRGRIKRMLLSSEECVQISIILDARLEDIDRNMPSSWQYSTTTAEKSLDYAFGQRVDIYKNRGICQSWNGLRVLRILLNESIIRSHMDSPQASEESAVVENSIATIKKLSSEICASVPQYGHYENTTPQDPRNSDAPGTLSRISGQDVKAAVGSHHTPDRLLDCYTLMFPMYVAGSSMVVSTGMRGWVVTKLNYLASHFRIRSAQVVAQILERGTDIDPWEVYSLTGSYAFAA